MRSCAPLPTLTPSPWYCTTVIVPMCPVHPAPRCTASCPPGVDDVSGTFWSKVTLTDVRSTGPRQIHVLSTSVTEPVDTGAAALAAPAASTAAATSSAAPSQRAREDADAWSTVPGCLADARRRSERTASVAPAHGGARSPHEGASGIRA